MIRAHVTGVGPIVQDLERIGHVFDLDDGLGTDILDIATWEILASMDSETDPDGIPWSPLSDSYLEWKSEIAPQAPIGVLYGLMKTWEQIAGERQVHSMGAYMTYGVTPDAKIEAVKFSEGGVVTGTNQPPRPFYAITTAAAIRVDAKLETIFTAAW